MEDFSFKRGERLKSRKEIARLFQKGQSFGQYPLRLIWLEKKEKEGDFPIQLAVSVPKKKFKKAYQRNRIKRQIKEAYRLQRTHLYTQLEVEGRSFSWMLIYS